MGDQLVEGRGGQAGQGGPGASRGQGGSGASAARCQKRVEKSPDSVRGFKVSGVCCLCSIERRSLDHLLG